MQQPLLPFLRYLHVNLLFIYSTFWGGSRVEKTIQSNFPGVYDNTFSDTSFRVFPKINNPSRNFKKTTDLIWNSSTSRTDP